MRFEDIKKLSFEDKKQIVEIIIKEYEKAKKHIENDGPTKQEDMNLITIVNCVLNLVNKNHKQVIENDFISNTNNKWWESQYTSQEYAKLKLEALDNFTYYILI